MNGTRKGRPVQGGARRRGDSRHACPRAVRLVVVDDDADIRLILATFARADDRFDVVGQARDGIEAAAVVAASRPDVVIMDVRMPHRDGLATIPHLRATCPGIGIVMYSANSVQIEDAFDLGADVWHTKGDPITAVLDSAAAVGSRSLDAPAEAASEQRDG